MNEPCIDCADRNVDDYGYLCDLACGRRTVWINYQAGQNEEKVKVRSIYKNANDLKELEDLIREYLDTTTSGMV